MTRNITPEAYQDWAELVKSIAVNDEAIREAALAGDYGAFEAVLRAEMPRIAEQTQDVVARNAQRASDPAYMDALALATYTGLLREDFRARWQR